MNPKRSHRAKRIDRIATAVITLGGMAIIGSVFLILLLIAKEALPLFYPTQSEPLAVMPAKDAGAQSPDNVLALGIDEYLSGAILVDAQGRMRFQALDTGNVLRIEQLAPPDASNGTLSAVDTYGDLNFALYWENGAVSLLHVVTDYTFDEEGRRESLEYALEPLGVFKPADEGPPPLRTSARHGDSGGLVRADLLPGDRFRITQQVVEENIFGEKTTSQQSHLLEPETSGRITAFTLDSEGGQLFAATDAGELLRWELRETGAPELTDNIQAFEDGRAITALEMVLGDVSVAVGDAEGELTTWFPAKRYPNAEKEELSRIHHLVTHAAPIEYIVPSLRNKTLASVDRQGGIKLSHMTSEQHLLSLESPEPVRAAAMGARADGIAVLDATHTVRVWTVENPHPEVDAHMLFGKVWYENYDEPAYVWQSSGGTDAFEPKLSLMPLIFGSFKGTLYAMLYALPLALFGAIYVSQFTRPEVRNFIKTCIELMAAVPTVVIGFLMALWLAPVVEEHIVAILVGVGVLPIIFILFVILLQPFRRLRIVKRIEHGYEFLMLVPVLLLAGLVCYGLGSVFSAWLFQGDFALWLYEHAGQRYDQRNCIIIAFGLGFAVIPIIFSISEDSLSNVPHSLKAASMAVGATRWQTAWRVVLPAASPGIFAGSMIGFGRAIGETMIVLMATGNTPIMDWSIFNGMRTLSANIAVEIPEAPVGGTLYRVLFLSAVILFVITSFVNTGAELIRQYLRKKYGRFE